MSEFKLRLPVLNSQNVLNEVLYQQVHLNWTAYEGSLDLPLVMVFDGWEKANLKAKPHKRRRFPNILLSFIVEYAMYYANV